MNDDFYVGYLPKAPATLGSWIFRTVTVLVLAGLAAAAVLAVKQPPYANSNFEFGVVRDFSGVIETNPYPILQTANSSFLLVAPGKHGASGLVRPLEGKSVRLKGSLIERGPDRMLELLPESLPQTGQISTQAVPLSRDLGAIRLRGEIVDSKCYLGVMNPGNGKVHRDCAARCISGGAPPAFIVQDATGETQFLLLAGSDGRALKREVLSFVAEPLEIEGRLVRSGSHLVLKAEPSAFVRIPR
jgi:hypothetical protein